MADEPWRRAESTLTPEQRAKAEEKARWLLAKQPDHVDALHLLAICRFEAGAVEEAAEHLGRAATLRPDRPDLLTAHGNALYWLARPDDAMRSLEAALAIQPNFPLANFMLGTIQHQRGEFDAAMVSYRRTLEHEPGHQGAQNCLEAAEAGLFFGQGSGWQGAHTPERQVFMSAALWTLRDAAHPLRILEIGSYMGASTVTWARALDTFVGKPASILCVDTWHVDAGARLPSNEMDLLLWRTDGAYQAFCNNVRTVPASVTVEHRRGSSRDVMPELPAASFDLVYIDGSHHYEDVADDIRNTDRLLRDGGIVCGDDLEVQAHECDLDLARRNPHTDYMVDPRSGRPFHPGVAVAVGECLGMVTAYSGFWIMRKSGTGYLPVDLRATDALLPLHWPRRLVDTLRARFATSGEIGRLRN